MTKRTTIVGEHAMTKPSPATSAGLVIPNMWPSNCDKKTPAPMDATTVHGLDRLLLLSRNATPNSAPLADEAQTETGTPNSAIDTSLSTLTDAAAPTTPTVTSVDFMPGRTAAAHKSRD